MRNCRAGAEAGARAIKNGVAPAPKKIQNYAKLSNMKWQHFISFECIPTFLIVDWSRFGCTEPETFEHFTRSRNRNRSRPKYVRLRTSESRSMWYISEFFFPIYLMQPVDLKEPIEGSPVDSNINYAIICPAPSNEGSAQSNFLL